MIVSHSAIFLPDLQAEERFYKILFDKELIGRDMLKVVGL